MNPQSPENGRRSIQEYLDPTRAVTPRPQRRRELARLLGLPEDEFEEPDPVAARLNLIEDLMVEIRELTAGRVVA